MKLKLQVIRILGHVTSQTSKSRLTKLVIQHRLRSKRNNLETLPCDRLFTLLLLFSLRLFLDILQRHHNSLNITEIANNWHRIQHKTLKFTLRNRRLEWEFEIEPGQVRIDIEIGFLNSLLLLIRSERFRIHPSSLAASFSRSHHEVDDAELEFSNLQHNLVTMRETKNGRKLSGSLASFEKMRAVIWCYCGSWEFLSEHATVTLFWVRSSNHLD